MGLIGLSVFKRLSTYLLTDSSPPSLANGVAERVLIFLLDHVYIPFILSNVYLSDWYHGNC